MPVQTAELERQLKVVTRTGKYVVGRREVMRSLKGSKLLVWSASANVPEKILDECRTLEIPSLRFDGNPIELGRTCGIPYKVSVFAIKAQGDAVLDPFSSSRDYNLPGSTQVKKEPELPLQAAEEKKKKSRAEKEPERKKPDKKELTSEESEPKKTRKRKTRKQPEESANQDEEP